MNKTLAIITVGRAVQVLLGMALIKVATHFLSPKEMGYFSIITAVVGYFGLTLANPVGQYFNRQINEWRAQGSILSRLLIFCGYSVVASLAVFVILLVANHFLHLAPGVPHMTFATVATLFFASQTLNMTFLSLLVLLGYQGSYVLLLVLMSLCGLGFSSMAMLYWNPDAVTWVYGQALGHFVVAPIAFFSIIKKTQSKLKFPRQVEFTDLKERGQSVFRFVLPLAIATLFMWLAHEAFRFPIEMTAGLEYLGYFSVGMLIAQKIGNTIETIVTQVLFPDFFQRLVNSSKEDREGAWNQLLEKSLPVFLITAFFTCACAKPLVAVLASKDYESAWVFVLFLAFVQMFRSIGNVASMVAHSEKVTGKLVPPYAFGAVFCLGGVYMAGSTEHYYLLIPAVITVSGFLTMTLVFYCLKDLLQTQWPVKAVIKSLCFLPLFAIPEILTGLFEGAILPMAVSLAAGGALYAGSLYFILNFRSFNGARA